MLAAKELELGIKPGVYDIHIDQYHGGEGISRSGLMEYKRSPLHYRHKYIKGNNCAKPTQIITPRDALAFGNAFHTYVLEKDKYENEYYVIEKIARNTKAGKALFKEESEKANGKQLINTESQQLIERMAGRIDAHSEAKSLIAGAQYEKSIYWNDPSTELLCKARPDIWSQNFIADLKTANDASEDAFSKSVYNFGYHLQCAMIHLALKSIYDIEMTSFVFIVVEKESPNAVVVYTLAKEALFKGVEEVERLLVDMKENFDSGVWPSYRSAMVSLPAWAHKEELI